MTANTREDEKANDLANRDKIRAQRKAYELANCDKIRARKKAYYLTNRDKMRARKKAYYLAHPEKFKAQGKAYWESLPGGQRGYYFKRTYGLTQNDIDRLVAAQGGVCAICGKAWTSQGPHVDHDHATGKVRGILCFRCNAALGHISDDPRIVRAMIDYLTKFKKVRT